MAFDDARARVILFGGELPGTGLVRDTWEWDGQQWTQVEDTGPLPRRGHAMAYDPMRQRIVLFGGLTGAASATGDTWEWDGNLWTQVADTGPEPCHGAGMAFNGEAIELFGGSRPGTTGKRFQDTWEWDGEHWTLRQDIGPAARWGVAITTDVVRSRIVLFGGSPLEPGDAAAAGQLLADTWEHAGTAIQPPPGGGPPPGQGPPLAAFTITPAQVAANFQDTATFEAVLATPAQADVAVLLELLGGTEIGTIPVAAGATSGQVTLGPFDPQTIGVHEFQATCGGVSITATLTIVA
jgi:hypothetical protein